MSNLLKDNSKIMKFWDYKKNKNLNLDKLKSGSSQKAWWICEKNHSYQQAIKSKVKGIGCPICNNKLILKGYNDLATTNPELLNEWDYEKNKVYTPYTISKGAEKKVWWICPKCKQSYESYAYSKKKDVGCPYCSSKIIKPGLNDIFTKNPNWTKFWDNKKNKLNPYCLSVGSHKKVWWICSKCNKSFQRAISDIEGDEVLCKNCSITDGVEKRIKTIITNNGSFIENYPELAREWDYEKNIINPNQVTSNSKNKVWWICNNGHEWEASISNRIKGRRCPICSKEMSISFPEKAIVYYINQIDSNIEESYRPSFLKGKEIDIYLSSKNVGIEYDGSAWHKNKKRDIQKNELCNKNGLKLIRVREEGCPLLDNSSIDYYYKKNESFSNLNPIIEKIIDFIYEVKIDIDIERDRFEIYKLIDYSIKEKSLERMFPKIAKEWDYEKNQNLKPSQFYAHSSRKFWWKCEKGHSYNVSIAKRTDGSNCPYCSNQKILKGYNDLVTTNPDILKDWNYNKNDDKGIFPDNVSRGSNKKVWWICNNGHEWEASISNRIKGRNCPYCSGKKIIIGVNDVATTEPRILKMWDYKKNYTQPTQYSMGSDALIWWLCPSCNNSWQQRISHIAKGVGCPKCHYNINKDNDLQ